MLRPSTDILVEAGVKRDDLKDARDADLIAFEGERLTFSHPLLAAVAYDRLLPDERREIHARLAAASTDLLERGHHVARAAVGPDETAAIALDEAAEMAAELGDHAGAAALLRRAVELTASEDEAGDRRRMRAAIEHLLAGDLGAAATLCRVAIDRLPGGSLRASARRTLVQSTTGAGLSYGDCVDELMLALEDADGDQSLQAELHLEIAEVRLGMCSLDEAVRHCRLAVELAERVGEPATVVQSLALLGFAESMLGLGVTDAVQQAFERWDGTISWVGTPRMELGCVLIPVGRFDEAAELFEQEIAMAEELGIEAFEVVARGHLAESQLRAGRWRR
jgi:tetratricopeptide (TPR) repeat protein